MEHRKVLVADDEPDILEILKYNLTNEGYDVVTAKDGDEALEKIRRFQPDLIVLDVMMPKVSGFDVLDILANTPETANLKVVMLTALSQEADGKRAQELGVDDYLVKSQVVITDVIDRLKHHMGLS